jgi:hypothetical protein
MKKERTRVANPLQPPQAMRYMQQLRRLVAGLRVRARAKSCGECRGGVTSQKTAFFIVTAVITSNFTNYVESSTSRHFRNKMRKYLKGKINELETNSKNKNIDK